MAEDNNSGFRKVGDSLKFFPELNPSKSDREYKPSDRYRQAIKSSRKAFTDFLEAPFGESQLDPFLSNIEQIESSGGKNLRHRKMDKGMHKGQRAIGRFGLMPNTVKDLVKKVHNTKTVLGSNLPPNFKDKELLELLELDEKALSKAVASNPNLELKLARLLAKEVSIKQEDDPERMAYAWNMGSNLVKNNITDANLHEHQYIKKFKVNKDKLPTLPVEQKLLDEQAEKDRLENINTERPDDMKPLAHSTGLLRGLANVGARGLEKLGELSDNSIVDLGNGLKIDPTGIIGGIENVAGKGAKGLSKLISEAPTAAKSIKPIAEDSAITFKNIREKYGFGGESPVAGSVHKPDYSFVPKDKYALNPPRVETEHVFDLDSLKPLENSYAAPPVSEELMQIKEAKKLADDEESFQLLRNAIESRKKVENH